MSRILPSQHLALSMVHRDCLSNNVHVQPKQSGATTKQPLSLPWSNRSVRSRLLCSTQRGRHLLGRPSPLGRELAPEYGTPDLRHHGHHKGNVVSRFPLHLVPVNASGFRPRFQITNNGTSVCPIPLTPSDLLMDEHPRIRYM